MPGVYIPKIEVPNDGHPLIIGIMADGTVTDVYGCPIMDGKAIPVPDHGRLIVLPCRVGDVLYEVDLPEYGVIVCEVLEVLCINKHEAGMKDAPVVECVAVTVEVIEGHGEGSCYSFDLQDFGKTVFLTREEAEAARKEEGAI